MESKPFHSPPSRMAFVRSVLQAVAICVLFLLYRIPTLSRELSNGSAKEGYLNSIPQDTSISDSYDKNNYKCED